MEGQNINVGYVYQIFVLRNKKKRYTLTDLVHLHSYIQQKIKTSNITKAVITSLHVFVYEDSIIR